MDCELSPRQVKILEIVKSAIDSFNQIETYLISRDVSERCICSKFASYLEKAIAGTEFDTYVVDVEYNRGYEGREDNPKILDNKNIVVDLIVHKRGYDHRDGFNNLICIEMKKSYKRLDYQSDKDRLSKLTDGIHGYHYSAGYMILADADKKNNQYSLRIESDYYGYY